MRDFFTLNAQRLIRIVIIIAIASVLGLLAGQNDTGASLPESQPVAAPHARQAHSP
jgi:hypothetical protein